MARAIIRLMPTRFDIFGGEFVIADSGSLISRETSKVDGADQVPPWPL
jgi:hypothetical protein